MSIEYPVYIDVKYVNGAPSGEQLRLDFITNGDENDGGVEQYDDGGPLNRPSKQIQENVMILRNDTMRQQQSIIELVDAVNQIQGDGYAEIGQRLDTVELRASSNKTRIDNLNTQIGVASTDTTPATGLTLDVETNKTVLGNRHVDDKRNTADSAGAIWDEIWFIKKNLIGNVYNYDPNGNFAQSVDYNSGIAGQLQTMSTDFDTIQSDMSDIENQVADLSNNLATTVDHLVEDVGTRQDPNYDAGNNVYARLSGLESDTGVNTSQVASNSLSISGILTRVDDAEVAITSLQGTVSQHTSDINDMEDDIGTYTLGGTIKSNIQSNQASINGINTAIGNNVTPNSIRGRLSDIETTIGKPTDDTGTLYGEINTNASSISSLSDRVDALESIEQGVSSYAYLTSPGVVTETFSTTPVNVSTIVTFTGQVQDYTDTGSEISYSGADSHVGVTARGGISHDSVSNLTVTFNFIKTSEGIPETITVSRTIPPGMMRDITAAAPFHIKSGDTVAVEIETSATAELDIYDFSLKME